jgi:hypothetical protein
MGYNVGIFVKQEGEEDGLHSKNRKDYKWTEWNLT